MKIEATYDKDLTEEERAVAEAVTRVLGVVASEAARLDVCAACMMESVGSLLLRMSERVPHDDDEEEDTIGEP